jgi:glutathione S-transferase
MSSLAAGAAADLPTFYSRLTSNNAMRIELYLNLYNLRSNYNIVYVTHEEQLSLANNPSNKIPLLALPQSHHPIDSISEAQIILEFVAKSHPQGLIPTDLAQEARMNQIIRTHDLYIASPNSSSPSRNLHTQACLYIAPPKPGARRGVPAAMRAVLLKDLLHSLSMIEELLIPDAPTTLADLTLFPTLINCFIYLRKVYDYDVTTPDDASSRQQWQNSIEIVSAPIRQHTHNWLPSRIQSRLIDAWTNLGFSIEDAQTAARQRSTSPAYLSENGTLPADTCATSNTGKLWRNLPKLHALFAKSMTSDMFKCGGGAFFEAQDCDRLNENVTLIRSDIADNGKDLQWVYNGPPKLF